MRDEFSFFLLFSILNLNEVTQILFVFMASEALRRQPFPSLSVSSMLICTSILMVFVFSSTSVPPPPILIKGQVSI